MWDKVRIPFWQIIWQLLFVGAVQIVCSNIAVISNSVFLLSVFVISIPIWLILGIILASILK